VLLVVRVSMYVSKFWNGSGGSRRVLPHFYLYLYLPYPPSAPRLCASNDSSSTLSTIIVTAQFKDILMPRSKNKPSTFASSTGYHLGSGAVVNAIVDMPTVRDVLHCRKSRSSLTDLVQS
jgi:hypothetical protein